MQTRKQSLIETLTQISVKFVTATLLWILVRPYAMDIPAVGVTLIFTINSFVLGYAIRRCYNKE